MTPEEIIKTICSVTDCNQKSIQSKSRVRNIAKTRQYCGYYLYKLTDLTLSEIGEILRKDHSSISFYKGIVPEMAKYNKSTKEEYNKLNAIFGLVDEQEITYYDDYTVIRHKSCGFLGKY